MNQPVSSNPSGSNPPTVGERIKSRREELGLSLNQLAEAAGISKSTLHDLETRQNVRPSAELLYNIAEALNTTVAFLLGKRRNPLSDEAPIEIPAALEEFARRAKLTEEEKRRLACIKYRDKQPKTADDWEFVYEAIKRATRPRE
jgi:transcriptional regulator with XRE-family HTH domain